MEEKSLWAVKLKPKKPYQYLHSGPKLHLSQATLGLSPKGKQSKKRKQQRTIIKCKREGLPEIFICSLRPRTAESFQLDLLFDEDVEFSVTGSTSVHLVGYFEGWDGCAHDEEYDEDFIQDDISEDYDDDDEDENSIDEDEEEFENESEYDDSDEYDDIVPNTGVTIEELIDDEAKEARPKVKRDVESLDLDKNGTQSSEYVKNGNGCGRDESEDEDGFIFHRKKVISAKEGSDDDESEDGLTVPEEQGAAPKEDANENEDKSISAGKRKASVNETKPPKKSKVIEGPKDAVLEAAQEMAKKKMKKKGAKKSSAEDLPNNSKMTEDKTLSSEKEINLAIQASEGKVANDGNITNVVDGTPQKGTLVSPEGKSLGKKGSPAVRKFPNGLEIEVLAIGKPDGNLAKPGKRVSMYYTGKLQANGKIFDSKLNKKPFEFRLGVNEVIKGLDVGMNGMRVGDKRRITIPPQMGYGFKGVQGTVPGNSWLIFDVELVNVK